MIKVNMNVKEESVFHDLLINNMDDNTSIMSLKIPSHSFSYNNENPIYNITWKFKDESEIFKIICIVNFIKEHAPKKHYLILNMNYVPYINRNNATNNSTIINNFKYFVNIINSLNFDKVQIFDPCNYELANMINNVEICKDEFNELIKDAIKDCAPDYICFERYDDINKTSLVDSLPNLNSLLYLQNSPFTNEIKISFYMNTMNKFENKRILLIMNYISNYNYPIDDIYSKLLELGFSEIYIYTSHLSNSIMKSEILKSNFHNHNLKRIYTTDSLYEEEISLEKIIEYTI